MSDATIDLLVDGPDSGRLEADGVIALAHGAGAPMDSPFMATFATGLANRGHRVVRFEFPYMAARRGADGKRRPPNGTKTLLATWANVLEQLAARGAPADRVVIGGKSLGGRMASMLADDASVAGLVCLGYPFHAAGKPADDKRLGHLATLRTPTLIAQGERDALGNRDEIATYDLAATIELLWLPDGDHSFKPRVRSGHTEAGNLEVAIARTAEFADARLGRT